MPATYLSKISSTLDADTLAKCAETHEKRLASQAIALDDPRVELVAIATGIRTAKVRLAVASATSAARASGKLADRLASARAALALDAADRSLLEAASKVGKAPKADADKAAQAITDTSANGAQASL